METQEVKLFSYEEIFSIFNKMDELKASIKNKENELYGKMLAELDPSIYRPYSLKAILENDKLDNYRAEARQELLYISMELNKIFSRTNHP